MSSGASLRYSEIFFSIQGEGLYTGTPSVFLRTFGCNFRCMRFGLPKTTPKQKYNPEVKKLLDEGVHQKTQKFEDLPLVKTGCDTYASIYPEFKHLMKNKNIDEVVDELLETTTHNNWITPSGQDIHLILTGGEPLLGWQRLYVDLFKSPRMKNLRNLTFETNATQQIRDELKYYIEVEAPFFTTFSCSPKLSVSGESWEDAIKPEIVKSYYDIKNSQLYLKFVVADKNDVDEVDQAVSEYRAAGVDCPVYLMPLGGKVEEYQLNESQVAELSMQRGYRFSPRLHLNLYGNRWGT